ncbi:hypothetical protein GCM10008927_20160 [Amylibacter ulvae]|uniref:Uncharacterized protein n=1 Tax=Paramylibacter ulvae TaxID=1651968 RepID=A0ABQ3D2F5_9RHOB|nr:DUF6476 family protein [Amylibacter ulvae]GHA54328.1 hypothetical protein GCM10008927_20160 [Amylibacter ulvae]
MRETSQEEMPEPANLRFLRRLITILLITMIVGFVALIFLFVMRFSQEPATIALPNEITLPDGTNAAAFTQGDDWYAIVTDDDQILIYNRADGALRHTLNVK